MIATTCIDVIEICQKSYEFIDSIKNKKAAAMYTLFQEKINSTAHRKKLALAERQKYLNGEGASLVGMKYNKWRLIKNLSINDQ